MEAVPESIYNLPALLEAAAIAIPAVIHLWPAAVIFSIVGLSTGIGSVMGY